MPSSQPTSEAPRAGLPARPTAENRAFGPVAPVAAMSTLCGCDDGTAWRFFYDDASAPIVSSERVTIHRGTVLLEGAFPVPAVAKEFNTVGGVRASAVKKAGMALASGAGPSFCYSNCDGLTGRPGAPARTVLVEQDCGVSLRDALADPALRIPGPGGGKPLFPPGADRAAVVDKVFFDVCAHMRALHLAGYAHGDIRPNNIALRRFGQRAQDVRATLIDFESLGELGVPAGGFVNEYSDHARAYLGRLPLLLEADVYYAHMVRAQLELGEAEVSEKAVRACEEGLAREGFVAGEPGPGAPAVAPVAGIGPSVSVAPSTGVPSAPARSLCDADARTFDALAARLGLASVADLPPRELPKLYAACGYLDYLGLREVRERSEAGAGLVEVRPVRAQAPLDARALLDRLAVLVTNCVYELRDTGDGHVTCERFESWAREGGRALPDLQALGFSDTATAVRAVWRQGRIPGIDLDCRDTLSLVSEQVRAKQRINRAGKDRIAAYALDLVCACVREQRDFRTAAPRRRPKVVFVDGGSTTEPIVDGLCRLISQGGLTGLRIVTPSVRHAAQISECFMDCGYDDHFDDVALYVAGGLVRPGTQSTVSQAIGIKNQVENLRRALGAREGAFARPRFDLAFVGASRVGSDGVVTNTGGVSVENKLPALDAVRAYLVLDSTKICDPAFDHPVCDLATSPNVSVITNVNASNQVLAELARRFPGRIVEV